MYQLLAAGFLHPDRELAAGVADRGYALDVRDVAQGLVESLSATQAVDHPLVQAVSAFAAVEFASDTEALYHELAVEYARLFIGPPVPAVSPYETIHADSEPDAPALLMVGPSARAVLAAYREAGLNMAEGLNEPPDHIATEFEFMHYLCVKESAALQLGESDEAHRWRSARSTFLREHPGAWGIDFANQVAASTTNEFYRAIATIAAAFLRLEMETDAASPMTSSARG